ncbi:hypothetical protein ACGFIE_02305 [Micromonospora sp. NPDC049275]|uniref:hypothetical protein n=1 Tax=Micromonospora sp. NPDC049275 TaxID=3364268 RepID=UPI003721FBE7
MRRVPGRRSGAQRTFDPPNPQRAPPQNLRGPSVMAEREMVARPSPVAAFDRQATDAAASR